MHHDNGPLGSATIDRAEERRVELMKKFGFNAIRTSHNPPSRQFLDACDRLGILVIDEAFDHWQRPKNPEDYHCYFDEWHQRDLEAMILRDRNHPSVVIWSIGNEIPERADSSGLEITKNLSAIIKKIDTTRPVTAAICEFWDHKGRPWEDTAPAFALLDVGGYNYQWKRYESDHEKFPQRMMVGTESVAKEAFENWQMVEKHPFALGDFCVDFDGLPGRIGHWSRINRIPQRQTAVFAGMAVVQFLLRRYRHLRLQKTAIVLPRCSLENQQPRNGCSCTNSFGNAGNCEFLGLARRTAKLELGRQRRPETSGECLFQLS